MTIENMSGMRILVTGGLSGIGMSIVRALCSLGASVCVLDRDVENGITAETNPAGSSSVFFIQADVADDEQLRLAAHDVSEHLGGLDVIVNNAGILGTGGMIEDSQYQDMLEVLSTNLLGPALVAKHFVSELKLAGGGAVVNIASITALIGSESHPLYGATKGGLIALTYGLARQLGRFNIRVNCVCPGSVRGTNLLAHSRGFTLTQKETMGLIQRSPLKTMVTADDIAGAVVYLCSSQAKAITGTVFLMDAGELLGIRGGE